MKSVLIQGTNCTGKSTLVRNLIKSFGGVKSTEGKLLSFCEHEGKKIAIVGTYGKSNTGCGYDACYKYKKLPELAKMAKERGADYVFGEGMTLNTFGLTTTLFLHEHSEKGYVFHLCAENKTIVERLYKRSARNDLKYDMIFSKGRSSKAAFDKFVGIGVEGSKIRTDLLDEKQTMEHVLKKVGLKDGRKGAS